MKSGENFTYNSLKCYWKPKGKDACKKNPAQGRVKN